MGVREWAGQPREAVVQAGGRDIPQSAFARGVSQHTGHYWTTYLGWLRQGDGVVGEEDGDTVLCKYVELLCESGTRKLCCGLTKVRVTHWNNAYQVCCMALLVNLVLNSKEIWVNSCTEENYFIKWHSNHCTPQLWSCGTADLMINCKTPAQVKLPTFHPHVKPENFPHFTEA